MIPLIEKAIVDHVGEDVVESIVIKNQPQVSWKRGLFSVQGRGVRDTYD